MFPHEIWSIDLGFYIRDKSVANSQNVLFLAVFDCFSRKAFCRAAPRKTADEILRCFQSIVKEAKKLPKFIFADKGSEWYNEKFMSYCQEHGITLYSTHTGQKSYPVEQFIFSLKKNIARRLSYRRDRRWSIVLQNSVETYNLTKTPALDGLCPSEAIQPEYTGRLQTFFLKRLYEKNRSYRNRPPKFSKGDYVKRLLNDRTMRKRGDRIKFGKEINQISKVIKSNPATYKLHGLPGTYYSQSLIPVINPKLTEQSVAQRTILEILESRKFATKWLRSGKPIEYESRYLVLTENDKKFMTKSEIEEYDNGQIMLDSFLNQQKESK